MGIPEDYQLSEYTWPPDIQKVDYVLNKIYELATYKNNRGEDKEDSWYDFKTDYGAGMTQMMR